ncbi:MAG: hypothetical protein IJB83_02625 [Bacilli bacterium]|nr:hypothetical protein [Bacilli bacterium]
MQEEKLLKIINHYGVIPQLKHFQSEVFELTEAIIDYRYVEVYKGSPAEKYHKEHIAEEIADVEVMLLQFKEYYHINGNDILKIMNEKIDRQLKRLEKE